MCHHQASTTPQRVDVAQSEQIRPSPRANPQKLRPVYSPELPTDLHEFGRRKTRLAVVVITVTKTFDYSAGMTTVVSVEPAPSPPIQGPRPPRPRLQPRRAFTHRGRGRYNLAFWGGIDGSVRVRVRSPKMISRLGSWDMGQVRAASTNRQETARGTRRDG